MTVETEQLHTRGLVLHSEARYYDLLAWLLTLGREGEFRERLIELGGLRRGDSVLDVGCGTGTLAITAKERVGQSGAVVGIDASPEMIERAKRKARKAGVEVRFQIAAAEALPFADGSFDVIFSTLMLHHLSRTVRDQCAREMRRVLRRDGRIVAVDFAIPARERKGLLARFHRHGYMALSDIVDVLNRAGLQVREIGAVGVSDLQFAVATSSPDEASDPTLRSAPMTRSFDPLPAPRSIWAALVVFLLLVHLIIIRSAFSALAIPVLTTTGLVVLVAVMHSGFFGMIHTLFRRRRR